MCCISWCKLTDKWQAFSYISDHTEHNQCRLLNIYKKLISVPTCSNNSFILQLPFLWYVTSVHVSMLKFTWFIKWENSYIPTWGSPVFASILPSNPLILAVSSSWWQLPGTTEIVSTKNVSSFSYDLWISNLKGKDQGQPM